MTVSMAFRLADADAIERLARALAIKGEGRRCVLTPLSPAGYVSLERLSAGQGLAAPC